MGEIKKRRGIYILPRPISEFYVEEVYLQRDFGTIGGIIEHVINEKKNRSGSPPYVLTLRYSPGSEIIQYLLEKISEKGIGIFYVGRSSVPAVKLERMGVYVSDIYKFTDYNKQMGVLTDKFQEWLNTSGSLSEKSISLPPRPSVRSPGPVKVASVLRSEVLGERDDFNSDNGSDGLQDKINGDNSESISSVKTEGKQCAVILDISDLPPNYGGMALKIIIDSLIGFPGFSTDRGFGVPLVCVCCRMDTPLSTFIIGESAVIINISPPDREERIGLLNFLFDKLGIFTVDAGIIADLTEGWNVADIKRLISLALFRYFMGRKNTDMKMKASEVDNSDVQDRNAVGQNDVDNSEDVNTVSEHAGEEITDPTPVEGLSDTDLDGNDNKGEKKPFGYLGRTDPGLEKGAITTEFIAHLIEEGEVIPEKEGVPFNVPVSPTFRRYEIPSAAPAPVGIPSVGYTSVRSENISAYPAFGSYKESQLYQYAAYKHYDELVNILTKLDSGDKLNSRELAVLSEYPFILKKEPKNARILLERAKERVDRLLRVKKGGDRYN